jgi:hypothetical protein
MEIKDLSRELSQEEQAAVQGGDANGANLGLISMGPVAQLGGAGFSAFSPVTNVNVQAPTLTQTNVNLDNDLTQAVAAINDNDIASAVGSAIGNLNF